MNDSYISALSDLDRTGEPFVAVTLVDAVGSTPQEIGAKMLVDRSGLRFGTVGGGRVELKAIEVAQELLRSDDVTHRSRLVRWNLQSDVGMTCGGVVTLFFEVYQRPRWSLVLFGAGHVAQSLVRLLLTLECHVTVVDSRKEWLARLPDSPRVRAVQIDDLPTFVDQLVGDEFVLCITMGHRFDRPILQKILESDRTYPYLGAIGSRAKRKVMVRELVEAGLSPARAEQFLCPIGLPIGSNQPNEIAVSILAQLLEMRDQVRGVANVDSPSDDLERPLDA